MLVYVGPGPGDLVVSACDHVGISSIALVRLHVEHRLSIVTRLAKILAFKAAGLMSICWHQMQGCRGTGTRVFKAEVRIQTYSTSIIESDATTVWRQPIKTTSQLAA